MRRDQLRILLGITVFVFAVGLVWELVFGDSVSVAVRSVTMGVASSLLAASLIAAYVQWSSVGIVQYYRQWLTEQPNLEAAFRDAKVVEICAVSFWNTLFGKPWFRDEFKKRIAAHIDGKETCILLLKPDGTEIQRREAEGRPPEEGSIVDRNRQAVALVEAVLEEEGVQEYADFRRFFDYSPGSNWMRVDHRGYLVLLGHGRRGQHRGGFSPALLLEASRLGGNASLFDVYDRNFRGMWQQADRSWGHAVPLR